MTLAMVHEYWWIPVVIGGFLAIIAIIIGSVNNWSDGEKIRIWAQYLRISITTPPPQLSDYTVCAVLIIIAALFVAFGIYAISL